MSAIIAPTSVATAPRTRFTVFNRLAGAGGLLFLVLIVGQNILRAATVPASNATPEQVLDSAQRYAWTAHLLWITFVIGFPALFVFVVGLTRQAAATAPESEAWGWMGIASAGVISVLFGLLNVFSVTFVAARSALATDPNLTAVLWALHNAIFTLDFVAIAGALLGLGRAATIAGLIPRGMGWLTGVGAFLLTVAALPVVAEMQGSPVLIVGLLGFFCWLIFLAVASISLFRH